jgi:hypothetical protein
VGLGQGGHKKGVRLGRGTEGLCRLCGSCGSGTEVGQDGSCQSGG